MHLHLQKGCFKRQFKCKCCKLTTGGDTGLLTVSGTISLSLISRMTIYGIIFISLDKESIFFKIFCRSLRADPATKTTDDLVGAIMLWVPRSMWRRLVLVRERWWEGRRPVNLRGRKGLRYCCLDLMAEAFQAAESFGPIFTEPLGNFYKSFVLNFFIWPLVPPPHLLVPQILFFVG